MQRFRSLPLAPLPLALACCGGAENAPAAASLPEGSVIVALEAQVPERGSDRWIMWSPYGKQLPLEEVDGGWGTKLPLGPDGTPPINLKLMKSPGARYFDQLLIDFDRDGEFGESEVLETTPTERNRRYWSSFDAVVEIPVIDPLSGETAENPYPLGFWYVEDPRVPEEEPVLRFSRHGYMEGRTVLDSAEAVVLLTENVMDGVYGTEDSWALASADSVGDVLKAGYSRPIQEHAWLFEKAYRVSDLDPSGRRMILVPFEPGITRSEEEEMNDDLRVDREAARSGRTVTFHHDFEEAERLARSEGKPLFIDFETTWCGPCKIMDEWVYTADQVVDAAVPVVSVKVDGDERLDLKERFGITGFPTLILLDAEGRELRRASGYVNVSDMTEFLRSGD